MERQAKQELEYVRSGQSNWIRYGRLVEFQGNLSAEHRASQATHASGTTY